MSFLRLASTPAVHQRYGVIITNDDALAILEKLLGIPSVVYRHEPEGIVVAWQQLAQRKSASLKVWMDAYLAAFAIVVGLTIDVDFRRYESAGLKLSLLASP
jgi:predicted nucleic acid-binding protein